MRNKIVYVFLRDKIVGIDSILPFCMEIHGRCGYVVNFISFELETYKNIMGENIVIKDAINSIGRIDYVSSDRYKSKIISRLFIIYYLIKVIFNVSVKGSYIVHSDHFHVKPFVWIRWLFKKKNIIFMEKKSFNIKINNEDINSENQNLDVVYKNRMTYDEISEYGIEMYLKPPLLYAGKLIGHDKDWNYFKHPSAAKLKKIVFNDIRKNRYWIEFINKHSNKYIENEMPLVEFESGKILVFIATRITRTTDLDALIEFAGALKSLSKYTCTFPLFIKLHTYSDVEFINELFDLTIGEKNRERCVFTKLHPVVLATRATASVFANEGSIMNEFSKFKIPVIDLQIHEDILLKSHLSLSTKLSGDKLIKRYEARRIISDYIFTDAGSFDKFMEKMVKSSFKLNDINTIVDASNDNVPNTVLCDP